MTSSTPQDVRFIIVKFWTGRVMDEDVELYLKRFCEILQPVQKPTDQFGIWYGVRRYKVKLNKDSNGAPVQIPNTISMGPYNGKISYQGQTQRCFTCNANDHQAKDCSETKCWKCGQLGHRGKNCTETEVCNLCQKVGHSYFQCPVSYSNKLKSTTQHKEKLQTVSNVPTTGKKSDEPQIQSESQIQDGGDDTSTSGSDSSSESDGESDASGTSSSEDSSSNSEGSQRTSDTALSKRTTKNTGITALREEDMRNSKKATEHEKRLQQYTDNETGLKQDMQIDNETVTGLDLDYPSNFQGDEQLDVTAEAEWAETDMDNTNKQVSFRSKRRKRISPSETDKSKKIKE
ncbi:hypothetical protein QTP70_002736 [Hemibagrus guttatus]|uniref:CCHC-type domain-containing protein n=1 Tax=Hemibagrus guttatus TaxID=175788 RepID=A0AAE0UGX3_9TELE|nr:hypothetical protein QTP70_002736 [Hemibagrus guttatus]